LYLFCTGWFMVTLAPVLNLDALYAPIAIQDRYLYFPSVGVCVMGADFAVRLWRRIGSSTSPSSESAARGVLAAAVAALILSAVHLFYAQHYWHDEASMFSRCVEEAPELAFCHNRLGRALAAQGDFERAAAEFKSAIASDPNAGAGVYYDLSYAYEHLGERQAASDAAAQGFKRLTKPSLSQYADLAIAKDAAGDSVGAEGILKQAEAIPRGAEAAAVARAQIRFLHGDRKSAEEQLRDAIRSDPGNERASESLGAMVLAEGRFAEALVLFRKAEALAPGDARVHYMIASALYHLGKNGEALKECTIALNRAPDDSSVWALRDAIERGIAEH
jgi:predicted Zn-dependent protease